MMKTPPSVLERAAEILDSRKPVATHESAADWAAKSLDARRTAFWSAKLYHARHVAELKQVCLDLLRQKSVKIRDLVSGAWTPAQLEVEIDPKTMLPSPGSGVRLGDVEIELSREAIIEEMRARAQLRRLGAHASRARVKLVVDMAVGTSVGRARWERDSKPSFVRAWPARRFVRIERRKVPRDWETRWGEAARSVGWQGVYDKDGGSTKVALFFSPIWEALSAFGTPYPPFDYNSGMGLRRVSRAMTGALGLDEGKVGPHRWKNDAKIGLEAIPKAERAFLRKSLRGIGRINGDELVIPAEKPVGGKR